MSHEQDLASSFGQDHPEVVARSVETAPPQELASFLSQLPETVAAVIVNQSVPLSGALALAAMPQVSARAILARLRPGTCAALLLRLEPSVQRELLAQLTPRHAGAIKILLEHSPRQAARWMDPRVPAAPLEASADDAITLIMKEPEGALYYLYIVGQNQTLLGVVNMRELISAPPTTPVKDLMTESPERVRASDPIEVVLRHPGWKKNHALPVVDSANRFLGAIRYSAFRRLETEVGRTLTEADPTRTANALAEILWLGATAVAKTAETALLGPRPEDKRGNA